MRCLPRAIRLILYFIGMTGTLGSALALSLWEAVTYRNTAFAMVYCKRLFNVGKRGFGPAFPKYLLLRSSRRYSVSLGVGQWCAFGLRRVYESAEVSLYQDAAREDYFCQFG